MQTKKKVTGKSSTQEVASPRVSRRQKKEPENVEIQEKKVKELIASSARKQRVVGSIAKEDGDRVAGTNLITRYGLVVDETAAVSLVRDAHHAIDSTSINCGYNDETCNEKSETIFSPPFHISNSVAGEMENGVNFIKVFRSGDKQFQDCGKENLQVEILNNQGGSDLSPEVSAIYLSLKNSKLECVDECNQYPTSTDDCMEEDEYEEFDDFDPYYFIKNLPDLSSVVPTFRHALLPKQTRSCPMTTLVLDLDETLVHSTLEPCDNADFTFSVNFDFKEHTVFVRCRPYLKEFMEKVSGLFEIIIFTASQSIYAEQLLNMLDPKRKIFRHRVYRESCVFIDGNYLKDLSVLGRDLAHVIIIDNSPQAFGFQVDNGIPIESWFDDRSDKELLLLLPFLESLVGVDDVRPLIVKKFNLREKIEAAVCPLSSFGGDPFER